MSIREKLKQANEINDLLESDIFQKCFEEKPKLSEIVRNALEEEMQKCLGKNTIIEEIQPVVDVLLLALTNCIDSTQQIINGMKSFEQKPLQNPKILSRDTPNLQDLQNLLDRKKPISSVFSSAFNAIAPAPLNDNDEGEF